MMATLEEWSIPKEKMGRPLRKSTYVVPPEEADEESYDADTEDELPLRKVVDRMRKERRLGK